MSLKIDPDKYYSASGVLKHGFFQWIKSPHVFSKWLDSRQGKELLRPVVRLAGSKKLRFVKGSNLIELHKLAENEQLTITFNGKSLENSGKTA